MPIEWQQPVVRRLLAAGHENGGWGYARGAPGSAEPTALAVLALREVNEAIGERGAGLRYLSGLQRPDAMMRVPGVTNLKTIETSSSRYGLSACSPE